MHPSELPSASTSDPLRALVEALPLAAATLSSDGSLLTANAHFRMATGLDDASRAKEVQEALRAQVPAAQLDTPIALKDGLAAVAVARRIAGGQLLVWLEEQQERAARESRSGFLSIASHDVRGSIANTRSYASLLLSPRMELNERARHCAEVIQRNADRALQLLAECFDLFLHDHRALDLDCAEEELSAVLGEVVEQARALAAARGVRFVSQVPAQMPRARVDRGRLSQAALAFAAHSIERSQRGEPVRFEVRQRPDSMLVEVRDETPLDSTVDARGVYDAYARANSEGKLGTGFRLGLARTTIEAHGGEVGARSAGGTGSTFYFTLPLTKRGQAIRHAGRHAPPL